MFNYVRAKVRSVQLGMRMVLEPETKNHERYRNQEPIKVPEPRTVPEPRMVLEPRTKNGTGNQEPRTVLSGPGYYRESDLVLV